MRVLELYKVYEVEIFDFLLQLGNMRTIETHTEEKTWTKTNDRMYFH